MSLDRVLSQEEIDLVFRNLQNRRKTEDPALRAQPYDFRRPDRIAKDQLRAIHLLHDNFARSLASSLSAYLRAYVVVNLISVEQLAFLEFSQCLPSPTCIVSLSMKPFDGNAVLELNQNIVFPILEMLLGGSGRSQVKVEREITEIEQTILDGVFRIILHDLQEAWSPISPIQFAVEAHETEPQLLQMLAPNEAVVAVGIEIRIGEVAGMMNIGIPSIIIKMLRQRFDQQWSIRKSESSAADQRRMAALLANSNVRVDARIQGPSMSFADLMRLKPGDVVAFDYPTHRPVDVVMNGRRHSRARIVAHERKRCCELLEMESGPSASTLEPRAR
jgi:flagellar motor switch protein FliM